MLAAFGGSAGCVDRGLALRFLWLSTFGRDFWRWPLFAFFVLPVVVAHGGADLLHRLLADARNLFQLLGCHISQRFDCSDASRDQLLDHRSAEFSDLIDGSRWTALHRLHLLLDFLALFFFALDVDLPAQQFGRQPHVLSAL